MPAQPVDPIDPVAARRWADRTATLSPWLHDEVARRMAERLAWIRVPVQRWAQWEPVGDGAGDRALVGAHYPDAECLVVSRDPQRMRASRPGAPGRWWQRLGLGPARKATPEITAAPAEGAAQLVWANMLAHGDADPAALLGRWLHALSVNGFLMFSCFGPDTLRELRALYAELGWPPPVQEFTDLHDWGDRLVTAGFADPVMDMEHLTLTFDTPERLLAELRDLGRNLHPGRHTTLRTPRWRDRLLATLDERLRPRPGAPLALTFELVYGHALRPAPRAPQAPMRFTRRRGSEPAPEVVKNVQPD